MNKLIDKTLKAVEKYTAMDFALLKITLVSIGILLGTYFAKFFSNYTSLLWVIFIGSYLMIMYKTFFKYMK